MLLSVCLMVAAAGPARSGKPTEVGATVAADKVQIDDIPGKMGSVALSHAIHARTYKGPDGGAIGCKTCHHTLAEAEPRPGEPIPRCRACHAQPGEPAKIIGGKTTRALAEMKPDGALEPRSILFHALCVNGCHKQITTTRKLYVCKTCHEKGITSEVVHGRFDAPESR